MIGVTFGLSLEVTRRYDPSVTTKAEWIITSCEQCGSPIRQLDDPGRRRAYCSNACRQRAYRARGGRASGTRYESAGAQRRREQEEAWERQKAKAEQERQRAYERRHDSPWTPPKERPGWCGDRFGDDPVRKAKRRRARLLWERSVHQGTNEHEAQACWERAEKIRAEYGL